MGRQIGVLLSLADEQRLLEIAHESGLVLVGQYLRGPDILAEQLHELPPDNDARPEDFHCFLLPEPVARARKATSATDHYFVSSRLPYIEWDRTRRPVDPERVAQNRTTNRLHISSDWNYGEDQRWMPSLIAAYEALVKEVKRSTEAIVLSGNRRLYISTSLDAAVREQMQLLLRSR